MRTKCKSKEQGRSKSRSRNGGHKVLSKWDKFHWRQRFCEYISNILSRWGSVNFKNFIINGISNEMVMNIKMLVTLGISAMAVAGLESTHIGITSLDGNSRFFNRFLANLISQAHSLMAWYSASQLDKQTCGNFLECQKRGFPFALRVYP